MIGLVLGGLTAAAHHLLFTGWYFQWYSDSGIYLLAPMLQVLLSFSTGMLYASAMQQLAEVHFERRRQFLQSRLPPRARFC